MKFIRPVLWSGLALLSAFAFYDRYWRWRGCFNELGRCYDTENGVLLEQAGVIWGTFALVFSLLFARSLWRIRGRETSSE
ncbi:MAG TPA: hypothetical protein VEZ16_08435 [Microvirga sp.]|nr:hypothetical protein [Microvirga sp.]